MIPIMNLLAYHLAQERRRRRLAGIFLQIFATFLVVLKNEFLGFIFSIVFRGFPTCFIA